MDSVDSLIPGFLLTPRSDALDFGGAAGVLLVVFSSVYDNPRWANKLNGAFVKLGHCREAVQKGGIESGSLFTCINECAKTGRWESLFMHRDLQVKFRPDGGFPRELADGVTAAFKSEYLGNKHELMLETFDSLKSEGHYACLVPIVQSSGMGKSKTVYRIAQDRIVIPICLREEDSPDTFSYPCPDGKVRDHLKKAPSAAEEAECKGYLRAFLVSLFSNVTLKVIELSRKTKGPSAMDVDVAPMTYSDLALAFLNFFDKEEQRNTFYNQVLSSSTRRVDNPMLLKEVENLEDTLKGRCKDLPKGYAFILALDEVHILYERRSDDSHTSHNLFSRLKSVLSEVAGCDLCVVALSTATSLTGIAPSKEAAPSFRERDTDTDLPAPFTELPYDAFLIDKPLKSGTLELSSVGTLEFAARFGRPLWYGMYMSRKKNRVASHLILRKMMGVVKTKLAGHELPLPPIEFGVRSIAILSARLLLDLSPATSRARRYEKELIRSHLRVVYSVHLDREVLISGSSPEPLIAEAAAQIMNDTTDRNVAYMNVWDLLLQYVDTGLGGQGDIGELIGRTLSIRAMDAAINSQNHVCELKYQTPIPVNDYYKALLTAPAWNKLRNSLPANHRELNDEDGRKSFEEAFKGAYLHFSHYARANDETPLNANYGWALWLRGTAVLCQLNQERTDRAIPIHFPTIGGVSPESISYILEQDKTGVTADPRVIAIQSAEELNLFSGLTSLPYIAAVHCYALAENERLEVLEPPPYSLRNKSGRSAKAPRYQFDIYGLASYGLLDNSTRAAIRSTINRTKSYLFDKHPRPYGLQAVRQLQPFITGEPETSAWFGGYSNKK